MSSRYDAGEGPDDPVFRKIVADLSEHRFSVIQNALPAGLVRGLLEQAHGMDRGLFRPAGVGRRQGRQFDPTIRGDVIHWIEGETQAEQDWLQWTDALRLYLNRQLYLGLARFESHFACYAPGDFYSRHRDAFRPEDSSGKDCRVVSIATYFNDGWQETDGGQLVLFHGGNDESLLQVLPESGTLVVFMSEDIPHEVLPGCRDRYSIAGWYRTA